LGVRVGIDAGLAARCRQECMPSEGTTQAASSSISLEPANSHAATDGGFVSGGRRSRVLSHSHSGTLDIRPAVRCGRERRRKIVVATRAAERPYQRAEAIGRRGAGPAFCGYPAAGCCKFASDSIDNQYGQRAARLGSINNNGRIAQPAAARRTQCRVDTRPGRRCEQPSRQESHLPV
jgi:hypothetical protein